MVNTSLFHGIAENLFGRLDVDFNQTQKDPNGGLCVEVKNLLDDVSEENQKSLIENLKKFSSFELKKLSEPEKFHSEIRRLAEVDAPFSSNNPVKADLEVLQQIFSFTATLYARREELKEQINHAPADSTDQKVKLLADLKDQLTLAVSNLKEYVLEPILGSLDKLYDAPNRTEAYDGGLKNLKTRLISTYNDEFSRFLGT